MYPLRPVERRRAPSLNRRLQRILTDTLNGSKGVYRPTDLSIGVTQWIYVAWLHNGHNQQTAAAYFAEERRADVAPTDLLNGYKSMSVSASVVRCTTDQLQVQGVV